MTRLVVLLVIAFTSEAFAESYRILIVNGHAEVKYEINLAKQPAALVKRSKFGTQTKNINEKDKAFLLSEFKNIFSKKSDAAKECPRNYIILTDMKKAAVGCLDQHSEMTKRFSQTLNALSLYMDVEAK